MKSPVGSPRFLRWEEIPDVVERSWQLVARTPDFDAWLIVWPAGGRVELHDHGTSRGALSVLSGTLVETVPHRDEWGRLDLLRCDLQTGVTLRFDQGHVHDVLNEGPEPAISLHVYSPALTSMTHFDLVGDQLAAREVSFTDDGWEDDGGSVLLDPTALRLGGAMTRSVDDLLAQARLEIERVDPGELERLRAEGALVVDIRPERQRAEEGELPFGIVVERNVLEWRFDLLGDHALPEVKGTTSRWSWCVLKATPRALPRPRCTNSGSSWPPTSKVDIGPGGPGAATPCRRSRSPASRPTESSPRLLP